MRPRARVVWISQASIYKEGEIWAFTDTTATGKYANQEITEKLLILMSLLVMDTCPETTLKG